MLQEKYQEWLKNAMIILFILFTVYIGHYILTDAQETLVKTYTINVYSSFFINFVFYFIIGMLIGLDRFLEEKKKVGTWAIKISKLVLIGLPALYFSMGLFITYNPTLHDTLLTYPIKTLINSQGEDFISIFKVLLGHTLITSFYKK